MQPIPPEFTEGNFQYRQVERHGALALYTQTHRHATLGRYEVVRIRVSPAHTWPNGHTTPEHEAYPGSSSWGRDGFTCFTLEQGRALLSTWGRPPTEEHADEPSQTAIPPAVEGVE